jgi:pyruvate kinase
MPTPDASLAEIETLCERIATDSKALLAQWSAWQIQPSYQPSAENLAAYLALRRHDLRPLQHDLMELGLSSLGRLESRVMETLAAVRTALAALSGKAPSPPAAQSGFFAGEARLDARTRHLFGPRRRGRPVALLVTCPSTAADDPDFMRKLAEHGVEAIRINCAHDGPEQWARMIDHARAAQAETGHSLRVFMDLAGPKIRTGEVRANHHVKRLFPGDRLAIVAPGDLERAVPADVAFTCECTLPEILQQAQPGQRLLIDDGKITTTIDAVTEGAIIASVTRCKEEGAKLKPEKGINLPDTDLLVPALTDKDIDDLAFIAAHADGVEFSFVQHPDDVALLQDTLERLRPDDWHELALILKIETARAVHYLPDIIVRAAARQPVAIMIARGDLALEIGFARLAEMQEEILWIAEAAQVPVIWATQVLEHLVKEGMPNRGELTDAASAARAECVMLNKGPYLFEAIAALDQLLGRMEDHLHKKTPQLRRLSSWDGHPLS